MQNFDLGTDNPVIRYFDAREFGRGDHMIFNGCFFEPPSLRSRDHDNDHDNDKNNDQENNNENKNEEKRTMMCVYRTTPSIQAWFESNIRIIKLRKEGDALIPLPETDRSLVAHGEDPRVTPLTHRHLLVTYTDVTDETNTRALIKGQIFLADYARQEYTSVKTLTFDLNCSRQNKQKNWNFVVDPYTQHVLLIYRLMPFEIYDLGHVNHVLFARSDFYEKDIGAMECLLRTHLIQRQAWKHPLSDILLLRGGSNPVYIKESEFYMFVHSASYKIFCIVMRKTPDNDALSSSPSSSSPLNAQSKHSLSRQSEHLLSKQSRQSKQSGQWRITKVGDRPIIYHDTNIDKKEVHFPGGTVYDRASQTFHVCLGLHDKQLGYIHLDKHWVDAHLVDVENIL